MDLFFSKDFFERTIYNLKLYESHNKKDKIEFKHEVVQLINSLLGLVVFVKEDGVNFSSVELSDVKLENDIIWNYCDRNGGRFEEKNFKNFLRHIRNAIAHKRLTIKSYRQQNIRSVVFKDENKNNKFEVELSIKEIKDLIYKLSECIGKQ